MKKKKIKKGAKNKINIYIIKGRKNRLPFKEPKLCALMTGVISLVNNDIPARTGGKITDKLQAIRVRQEIYSFLDVAQS